MHRKSYHQNKSGDTFPVEVTCHHLKLREQECEFAFVQDISERKQKTEQLKETNNLLAGIFESIQDGISVLNPDLTIRHTNWVMEKWYQESLPLQGKKCYQAYHNRQVPCIDCPSLRCIKSGEVEKEEVLGPEDSEVDYLEVFSYPMFDKDSGEIEGVVEFVRDITERKKKEKKLEYLSYSDFLTGLYNRRFFEEKIKRLDVQKQLPISIIVFDVNGLKIINETYGNQKGDQILIKVADILSSTIRQEDILARWAGDEFVALLPQTNKKEAEEFCKQIREKCAASRDDKNPISLGMGVAVKERVGEDIYEVLHQADEYMYQDKLVNSRSAKNKVVESLLNTLGAKSDETEEHALRMAEFATKLGEKLGLSNTQLNKLSLLATLHDIGKVTIPDQILSKSGDLTEEEWQIIKEHPERGYRIALATEEFAPVADLILAHHERWDGNGYPQGLAGEEIPFLARIITIVDAYDVMSSGRVYKEAMSKEKVLTELKRCAGSQFDPNLIEEFINIV
ncbi:HD domain-containing phosphohydrolase [Fuchsiella alkaliacetigena]|uniref:HD domain-containing phosphohydrolase n=1 Tax=Fuchsiella alkaliacetigena TaxID=957042 RepID=UPI00200A9552|nr:HD domain-containing phosphohydrolase [Fuchsiella alkaliacetigena]MCK8825963.1 diguanylate cyclase [Fuchsiella alkaliacetigena]